MLRVRYDLEASNYFFDNGELTRDLMIAVETLVFTDGIPESGDYVQMPSGTHLWVTAGHIVAYRITGNDLVILAVNPIE